MLFLAQTREWGEKFLSLHLAGKKALNPEKCFNYRTMMLKKLLHSYTTESSKMFCIALLLQAFIIFDFINLGNVCNVHALIDGKYELKEAQRTIY